MRRVSVLGLIELQGQRLDVYMMSLGKGKDESMTSKRKLCGWLIDNGVAIKWKSIKAAGPSQNEPIL